MRNFLFTALCICGLHVNAQFKISGFITNSENQQNLAGASISIKNTYKGVFSDSRGYYELKNLKDGPYTLVVNFIGFEKQEFELNLDSDKTMNFSLKPSAILTDEVIISATRADENTPITFKNINKEELEKQNFGQDLPYLLNFSPSVVTTSDAGAGVGYTGIRIRGTDPTRINVTINGIPINDAESHGTFWVNMPDFASSVDNIQIQRGVGTSSNGAASFGASINLQTNTVKTEPFAEINNSFGSFNTRKNNIVAGTGVINKHFSFEGRASQIVSDGFVDRASSNLNAYFLSGNYFTSKTLIKLNVFSGNEKTYQSWYGIPKAALDTNRTWNYYNYQNQTDNYKQTHYQLFLNHQINDFWKANIAFHYTKGAGYYEEFRENDAFTNYGLNDLVIGADTFVTNDFIRRRWLENDFYGTVFSLNYQKSKVNFTIGGGANQYDGKHFGEIIWSRLAGNNDFINDRYYENDAVKKDFNIYSKLNYAVLNNLNVFIDLQYRAIDYTYFGFDNNLSNITQNAKFNFFNPKIGLFYKMNDKNNFYASYAIANKEPARDEMVNSTPQNRPKHETLNDLEIGYKLNLKRMALQINIFSMDYVNQLVLTGQINDVGAYIRSNVVKSYRRGIEFESGFAITRWMNWNINTTLSINKIQDLEYFIDDYDNYTQQKLIYKNTDIAFSPNLIAGSQLIFKPLNNIEFALLSKYVGKQYLDNTSSKNKTLDAYFTNDVRLIYNLKSKAIKNIQFALLVNNVFNEMYESNGYTFSYLYNQTLTTENWFYPQAGTNFMASINFKF